MNREKFRVIKLAQQLDRNGLRWLAAKCLVEALVSYWLILMPSLIVSALYKDPDGKSVWLCTGIILGIFAGLKLTASGLKKRFDEHKNLMTERYRELKIKKAFSVEFKWLETSEFEKIMQGIQYNDENFGAFGNYISELEKLFTNVVRLVYAGIVFTGIGIEMSRSGILREFFWLTGVMCILILLALLAIKKLQEYVNRKLPELMDKIVDLNTIDMVLYEDVVQNYHSGKDVRLFGLDKLVQEEEERMLSAYKPNSKKQIFLTQAAGIAGSILSVLIGGAAFIFLGIYGAKGILNPGVLLAYAGNVIGLVESVVSLAFVSGSMKLWNLRLSDSFKLLAMEEEPSEPGSRLDLSGGIDIRDIYFRYPESSEDTLKGISVNIKRGEKIAVVGRNGSGKSTFIKVLTGMYHPTAGEIYFSENNIDSIPINEYRKQFAAVYQDFTMFSFSIGENIAVNETYSEERIKEILQQLNMWEKIKNMPRGTDTFIYQDYADEGIEVSGGEAQKLSIARALYKDSPCIILDEPTSALDAQAEYEIYKDFRRMVTDKTAVFVSHRLSSCRFCDRILVFEDGRIKESGSHEELMRDEKSLYAALWNAQAQYYASSGS